MSLKEVPDMLRLWRFGTEYSKSFLKIKRSVKRIVALVQKDLPVGYIVEIDKTTYFDRDSFIYKGEELVSFNKEVCYDIIRLSGEYFFYKVYRDLNEKNIFHHGLNSLYGYKNI